MTVAKNYLEQNEIKYLNRLTTMLLDYTENQIQKGNLFKMKDWLLRLDKFLEFNEYEVLQNYVKITKKFADNFAVNEYEKYKEVIQEAENKEYIGFIENIQKQVNYLKKVRKILKYQIRLYNQDQEF